MFKYSLKILNIENIDLSKFPTTFLRRMVSYHNFIILNEWLLKYKTCAVDTESILPMLFQIVIMHSWQIPCRYYQIFFFHSRSDDLSGSPFIESEGDFVRRKAFEEEAANESYNTLGMCAYGGDDANKANAMTSRNISNLIPHIILSPDWTNTLHVWKE